MSTGITSQGILDFHSHILPGIDDGSRNWDMTMEMLQLSWDAGVRAMVATPHFLPWGHRLRKEKVLALTAEAQERAQRDLGIDMKIYPGEELYYHSGLLQDLEEGRALTLAGSRYVLVEFSEQASFREIHTAAASFRRSPWTLIIAHVERFESLYREQDLQEILDMGALLQSNAEEMERGFLDRRKRWLKKRYDARQITFVGSDTHDPVKRPPLSDRSLRWFRDHLDASYREALLWDNAVRLLEQRE